MNVYEIDFLSECPNNGHEIRYRIRIKTHRVILVETLRSTVKSIRGLHEEIADHLAQKFGGRQTIVAYHDGVKIKTTRVEK